MHQHSNCRSHNVVCCCKYTVRLYAACNCQPVHFDCVLVTPLSACSTPFYGLTFVADSAELPCRPCASLLVNAAAVAECSV